MLASVSKQLNEYKVLPLPENYARELSHGVDIDSLAIQKIVDQTKINPFTYFRFTENVSTEKVPSDESFIYFVGQLFFNRHQLAAPLFELAAKYNSLPVSDVDTLLSKFAKDMKNYSNTFITYKNMPFRINRAHINQLLDKITNAPLSESASIHEYISSFFLFCILLS